MITNITTEVQLAPARFSWMRIVIGALHHAGLWIKPPCSWSNCRHSALV